MSFLPNSAPVLKLYALPTGRFHLPDRWLFEDGDEDTTKARQHSPDFSFLIVHPSGQKVIFDLGMRKDMHNWPLVIRNDVGSLSPSVPKDIVDLLAAGDINPSDIDTVILSHLHFDHVGDVSLFPTSNILVGPGSKAFTFPGYPADEKSPFFSEVLNHPNFSELQFSDREAGFGPFDHAHDLFGDASFFLIDTPGHMPGHLAALIHTGEDEWVFTGGDCCHHRAILKGKRQISITRGPNGTKSFHAKPELAMRTIEKVRLLESDGAGRVLVALPHDATLDGLMPLFPEELGGWRGSEWVSALEERLEGLYPSGKVNGHGTNAHSANGNGC